MPLTPTHKPTREWPLLVLALALVGFVCLPLRQWLLVQPAGTLPERLGRLFLGPEQIACYCCFVWSGFVLLSRYLELVRQRRGFGLDLLPTDEGARLLPQDARPLQRQIPPLTGRRGPYTLANMIRLALGKYAVSRSSRDVSDTIRTQTEVDLGRMVATMATVHYLAWAIPALGFLGTVRGLAMSLSMAGNQDSSIREFLQQATTHLNVAFDCTLVALALSLALMFLIHSVQRDEEALVLDCQQYCLEHLVNRLYEPEPGPEAPARESERGEVMRW